MEWYEEEVHEMEQRRQNSPPPAGMVAFYGSSSMRLWESLEEHFSSNGVINLAFGGSTMAACAWFFERLVVPCHPRSIICYAGDNDLGDGRSPDEVMASFRELLMKVDAHFPTIPFTILSIKASPSRWHLVDKIRDTNELMHREIEGRDKGHFIDVFSAMLGSNGRPDESLFLDDGLHVSRQGYIVWKQLLLDNSGDIF